MTMMMRVLLLTAGALLTALTQPATAADPAPTVITISDLDCPSCAKKVAAKLAEVPGVAKVETDVEAQTATVIPQPKAAPSPKALWEAVEKAKKTPAKLAGPGGTFTAKPKV
jgi:Cu+-exporting ATPase